MCGFKSMLNVMDIVDYRWILLVHRHLPNVQSVFLDTLFDLFNSHDQRIHSLEGGLFHPYFFVGFSVVSFYIA